MATKPQKAEIRSFQVGFGDCFLLTFVYGEQDRRHVLIDFGTTALPRRGNKAGSPKEHMPKVAAQIQRIVGEGNRLTAVVATHRHADHISGFGTTTATGESGKIIRALRPRYVLQPWTEKPDARVNAKSATNGAAAQKRFVDSLATMNHIAGRVQQFAEASPAWMSASVRKELQFLGADNIANKSAVENLIAMGAQPGAKAKYLRYGDDTGLERWLPGVKVHVLGPPDLTQTDGIRAQRSKDADEFWHFVQGAVSLRAAQVAPAQRSHARNGNDGNNGAVPTEARWFRDRLQQLSGQSLLEIVRQLDQQMNNTSLILLFEFNGKKLLFPGDAQLENWSYALTEAKDSKQVCKMLAGVDFYKVGHHGSLNATPRKLLWEKFEKRKGKKLRTMISTLSGKHGSTAKKTEVPRRTLLAALNKQSQLKSTQGLSANQLEQITII